jgi:branched-chain amino acid transport system ATP-binding protein
MLAVDDVSVQFGGHRALKGVTLEAAPGEIVGLIGPNGAGKTTLFNVITGLQAPSGGTVRLAGQDVTKLQPYRRARLGISRTFQKLQLFGTLTVAENIELAAPAKRSAETPGERATRLMDMLGIAHLADDLAHTVPTGQARLIELARALAAEPKLILLDEPASGQDHAETEHFKLTLQNVAADGIGILIVEHDVPLVMEVCSRIYVLDFGEMIAHDTPEQIREDPKVIAAYLGTDEQVTA